MKSFQHPNSQHLHPNNPFIYCLVPVVMTFWSHASIYPHQFFSSWCHLICEVHLSCRRKTPTNQPNTNNTYHNSVLPLLLQDGVLNLVSFCPFSFKCSSNLYNQKLQFSFIKLNWRATTLCYGSQGPTTYGPWEHLKKWILSNGFLLYEQPVSSCRYKDSLYPSFSQHLNKVRCFCSGVKTPTPHQNTSTELVISLMAGDFTDVYTWVFDV